MAADLSNKPLAPPEAPKSLTQAAGGRGVIASQEVGRLFAQVYDELRAIAQHQMAQERPYHTLRVTELVHEAYLRLANSSGIDCQDRAHFFHATAEAMRRILVEHARRRARLKRGGNHQRVPLSVVELVFPQEPEEMLALDEALGRLEEQDARAAAVVRLRYFAGRTIEETAEAMNLSPRTVKREWEFARAWLYRQLSG